MERAPTGHTWTDDELVALDAAGDRVELVDGVLHDMSPGGGRHGAVVATLTALLVRHAQEQQAGTVFGSETGYRLDDANCLAPDVSFVSAARLRQLLPDLDKFLTGAPDLVVEILSPNDSWAQAERKILVFIRHGTRLAWVIDPRARLVRVYRDSAGFETLTADARLSGEEGLPGLEIPVSALFRDLS